MKKVYLFSGSGANSDPASIPGIGVDHEPIGGFIRNSFRREHGYEVAEATAEAIQQGLLQKEPASLLVMPGGTGASHFARLLGSAGMENIRKAVHAGMDYIGFCAGASLATTEIQYGKTTHASFEQGETLGLLAVSTYGPLPTTVGYVNILDTQGHGHYAMNLGGAVFEVNSEAVKALGVYQTPQNLAGKSLTAAIVAGSFGRGKVLLSQPHLEYTQDHLAKLNSKFNSKRVLKKNGYADPGDNESYQLISHGLSSFFASFQTFPLSRVLFLTVWEQTQELPVVLKQPTRAAGRFGGITHWLQTRNSLRNLKGLVRKLPYKRGQQGPEIREKA